MTLKPDNHPVNNQHSGRDIAKAILTTKVGPEMAQEILDAFEGAPAPLGIFQRGHLRYVMDIVDKHKPTNLADQQAIEAFRKEMQWQAATNFADQVLTHCSTAQAGGASPLEIVIDINRKFPAELHYTSAMQDGESVQFRLPGGTYIVYDSAIETWEVRDKPLI